MRAHDAGRNLAERWGAKLPFRKESAVHEYTNTRPSVHEIYCGPTPRVRSSFGDLVPCAVTLQFPPDAISLHPLAGSWGDWEKREPISGRG
jgi:hypothetical protein